MRRICFSLIVALTAAAQTQQPEAPGVVFKTTSTLVIVNATVRDRSGKTVEGLKKEDFQVLEDGKPQTISVFEFEKLSDGEPGSAPSQPALAPGAEAPKPSPERQIAITPSKPGEVRYRDRRLMVLYFDFSSMPQPDQVRAQEAAEKFIRTQMSPADVVSIMAFVNSLKVLQDFTDDRDKLLEVIRGFRIGEGAALAGEADTADPDTGQDTGAAFTADETEFNIFNTDLKLSALESAVKMLASLPERKALAYFSSGVGKTGVENQSQLRATVNAAVRSNVAFYPIDSRGLSALPPGGDASQAAARGTGIYSGKQQTTERARFNDQQETLVTLAGDTGGKVFLDNNDLSLGLTEAERDVRSYYILGYYSSNTSLDGRFRRVTVNLTGVTMAKAGLKLDYRSGYFGQKEFGKFTAGDKERQLSEALLLGDPMTDLPLALEVDYFRLKRDSYFVPVAVKIPGSKIAVAKKGSNQVTEFDFIGQVRDAQGKLAASVRDGIRVKLTESDASQLSRRSIQYDTGFTLAPGKYRLKFLARENQTGKMGTFETAFTIPDLSQPGQPALPLSSVVWSNQREPLASAVGSAGAKKKLIEMHPLVLGGQKLIPSVTRVFRKDQNLYVYFEVYDPATDKDTKAPSVAAELTLFRGKARASESEPVRITELPRTRANVAPFQFQVPLAKLKPGRYTAQVNVVDEVGRKFAFARAPLVVTP